MFALVFITSIFFYFGLNANHSFSFNNETTLWRKIVGYSLIIIGALAFLVNCIIQRITEGDLDYTSYTFTMGWALSFPLIIWGLYTLTSSKPKAPIWKRVILSIIYPIMTFFMLGSANVNFNIASISFIIVMINSLISIGINYNPKYKHQNKKITEKESIMVNQENNYKIFGSSYYYPSYPQKSFKTLHKSQNKHDDIFTRLDNYSEKMINKLLHNFRIYFFKILITFLIPCFLLLCLLWINNERLAAWSIFYIPYFFVILIYVEKLLWQKRKIKGMDLLLIPWFQKISLFKNEINRRIIIYTIVPSLLISIIFPLLSSFLETQRAYGLCHFFLIFPILCWIAVFAINYSYEWIKKENQNDIANV